MKKIFAALSIALLATPALAQSGTNSPYSMYGIGVLSDQGNSFNRGMNGVGLGLRPHNQINYLNPASYSAVDSLSFIFDAGLSLQMTNFKEGKVSKNAKNASFEYVVGGFRVAPNFGLAFGLLPVSNIGYQFTNTEYVDRGDASYTGVSNAYSGTGGLHEAFIGLGWSPVKGFSFGVNGGYLWGEMEHIINSTYTDSSAKSLKKKRNCSIGSYKLDFGVQYQHELNDKDVITVGATYGLGHSLNADPTLAIMSSGTVNDTTEFVAHDGIDFPSQIAAGVSYTHGTKWTVGVDYTLQQWADAKFPLEMKIESKDASGNVLGYVYTVKGSNSYGTIQLMVAISNDNIVHQVEFLENNQSFASTVASWVKQTFNNKGSEKHEAGFTSDSVSGKELTESELTSVDVKCGATYGATTVKTLVNIALTDKEAA